MQSVFSAFYFSGNNTIPTLPSFVASKADILFYGFFIKRFKDIFKKYELILPMAPLSLLFT